jgi:hypothetical protein
MSSALVANKKLIYATNSRIKTNKISSKLVN